MSRDKTQSHLRVIGAAKKEFLQYGFADASMRRIAKEAGITASALYKHFENKEEMFAALVQPVIDEFLQLYREREEEDFAMLEELTPENVMGSDTEMQQTMMFFYNHFEEMKLLICRSQGTRFENIIHEIAEKEEKTTLRYMETLRDKGVEVHDFDRKEFHLLVTASIEAALQPVMHDFTQEEAMHYAKTLDEFFRAGWRNYFGL